MLNLNNIFHKDTKNTIERDFDESHIDEKKIMLGELRTNLRSASSITEIFNNYFKSYSEQKHPLRKHRKNLLYNYGDTESYKKAIESILDASKIASIKTFEECNMWLRMYLEAQRSGTTIKSEWPVIHEVKKAAKNLYLMELEQKQTLDEVIDLFHKAKDDKNIFKHQSNLIFHDYHEYKHVLLATAKKAQDIISKITDPKDIDLLQTVKNIEEIKTDLESYKPGFPHEDWLSVEFHLKTKLIQLSSKELHDNSILNVHYNQKSHEVVYKVANRK